MADKSCGLVRDPGYAQSWKNAELEPRHGLRNSNATSRRCSKGSLPGEPDRVAGVPPDWSGTGWRKLRMADTRTPARDIFTVNRPWAGKQLKGEHASVASEPPPYADYRGGVVGERRFLAAKFDGGLAGLVARNSRGEMTRNGADIWTPRAEKNAPRDES